MLKSIITSITIKNDKEEKQVEKKLEERKDHGWKPSTSLADKPGKWRMVSQKHLRRGANYIAQNPRVRVWRDILI